MLVDCPQCLAEVTAGGDDLDLVAGLELDGLTQARHPGEIEDMARSYIAVSTDQPIDTIAVRIRVAGVKHAAAQGIASKILPGNGSVTRLFVVR